LSSFKWVFLGVDLDRTEETSLKSSIEIGRGKLKKRKPHKILAHIHYPERKGKL